MKNLIQQVLASTNLKQKDLAQKIGVSTAQISRWKQGEQIPLARREELRVLANISSVPDLMRLAGTKKNINYWRAVVRENLGDFPVRFFEDSLDFDDKLEELLLFFENLGFTPPFEPSESESAGLSELASKVLNHLDSIESWFFTFLSGLERNPKWSDTDLIEGIEVNLLNLTSSYLNEEEFPSIEKRKLLILKSETRTKVKEIIDDIYYELATTEEIPVPTNLYRLLEQDPGVLCFEAESFDMSHADDHLKYRDATTKEIIKTLRDLKDSIVRLEEKVDSFQGRI